MKVLSTIFLITAIIAAVLGSMTGIEPMIAFTAKIGLCVSIILCLVAWVTGLMKDDTKHMAH